MGERARPPKLNPELQERIVAALVAGNYVEPACRASGISPSTYYRWLERGEAEEEGLYRAFAEAVWKAEAAAEMSALRVIRGAMVEDWRAALAFLERRHAQRWGRRPAAERSEAAAPASLEARSQFDLSRLSQEELASLEGLLARISHSE